MRELVHERPLELVDGRGRLYRRALVYAERRPAGWWVPWIEFVAATGDRVLHHDRETTQSTREAVACWAERLPPTYFAGALEGACRLAVDSTALVPASPMSGRGMVSFRVRSADPRIPLRLIAADGRLVPGLRRQVADGGIVYVRAVEPALTWMPRIYEFLAHFRSESGAAMVANHLEADLQGTVATLEIRRAEVPVESSAIREALLAARARWPDLTGGR